MQLVVSRIVFMDIQLSKQAESAWITLMRTQQLLLIKVEAELKAAGLPPLAWYDVLLELSRDSEAGLRQFEIAQRVLLNKYNLSRLIDRLQNEGLVKRQACDDDGRGNIVKITKKGLQLKQQMWPVYAAAIQHLIADSLNSQQLKSLTELMRLLATPHLTTPA